jgi:hypothetical protein
VHVRVFSKDPKNYLFIISQKFEDKDLIAPTPPPPYSMDMRTAFKHDFKNWKKGNYY